MYIRVWAFVFVAGADLADAFGVKLIAAAA